MTAASSAGRGPLDLCDGGCGRPLQEWSVRNITRRGGSTAIDGRWYCCVFCALNPAGCDPCGLAAEVPAWYYEQGNPEALP